MRIAGLLVAKNIGLVVCVCFVSDLSISTALYASPRTAEQPDEVQGERVGSKTCRICHSNIYAEYGKTAMGRSVVAPHDKKDLAPFAPVTIDSGNLTYEVGRRGNDIYQSQYGIDASGKRVLRSSYRLEYAIGAGVNSISFAFAREKFLFQAPLSYYPRAKTWQLSPGMNIRTSVLTA